MIVDVVQVEVFDHWYDCYSIYFEDDFKDRYSDVEAVVLDTYAGGYYTKEESEQYGCVVFTIKKYHASHLDMTV